MIQGGIHVTQESCERYNLESLFFFFLSEILCNHKLSQWLRHSALVCMAVYEEVQSYDHPLFTFTYLSTVLYKCLWGVSVLQFWLLSLATHPFIIWYSSPYGPLSPTLMDSIHLLCTCILVGTTISNRYNFRLQLRHKCRKSCWISDKHNTLITKAVLFYDLCVIVKFKKQTSTLEMCGQHTHPLPLQH